MKQLIRLLDADWRGNMLLYLGWMGPETAVKEVPNYAFSENCVKSANKLTDK